VRKSFIKILLERRIPQILGSYFIAGTSLILFIEYLIDKYQFPSHYPTLALFGLISIIPSVIILAYFHGAPGKDEWTIIEKIGIPVNILFIAVVLMVGDLTDNTKETKEPLDSYYLHFTSTENYIDYHYKFKPQMGLLPFIVDSIYTPIYPIEDTMLYNITSDCFSYLNQQFQNKGTEIFSNFKESHTSIMDNFPFVSILDTTDEGISRPLYPIKQFSQILNVDEKNIPKVFMQILIYKTKNYNTGNEKLFKTVWWKIKRRGNISNSGGQFYDNNESGYKNLIKDLQEELLEDINRMRFSINPFHFWIGEIEEILPNNRINIKLYESNSIKNNLLLDAQTMYSHSVDGACKEEICIVGIKELLDDIQLGITYIEENKSTVPDSLFDEIYKLKQDFTRYEKLLDSLIQNDIHAPEHNWLSEPFYTVKVLEVFGDYAVAKLHTKNKPWAKIKVGHKLRMHK